MAREVGVSPQTVTNVQKAHSAETGQASPPPWVQTLREMESPVGARVVVGIGWEFMTAVWRSCRDRNLGHRSKRPFTNTLLI